MVQGMAFLSKKGFNPQNQVNRKRVYEAQQSSKLERERLQKRQEQLQREREDEELCAARHNGDGSQAQLRFMYDAPPGMKKEEEGKAQSEPRSTNGGVADLTTLQPGDDPATIAFRQMLAASTTTATGETGDTGIGETTEDGESKHRFAPVLQGSTLEVDLEKTTDSRSALEKAVGRKDRGGALSLEEQIARFPQLKNAPMAKGMSATDVNVSFKPLGAQLRNVKCLACGVWGHSRGDRECQSTGWDPFSASSISNSAGPPQLQSSLRPTEDDKMRKATKSDTKRDDDKDDDRSYSSSSSSSMSSYERRRRRKRHRKHREDRKHRRSESSRKRRRHRSESPDSRRRHRKSHKKSSSRRSDD